MMIEMFDSQSLIYPIFICRKQRLRFPDLKHWVDYPKIYREDCSLHIFESQ